MIHRPVQDIVDRPIVQARRDPPAELPQQSGSNVGPSPLFSQIEDEYLAIRENGGASAGAISTARWRTSVFKTMVGDRPLDQYMPIDLQNYVNELQYLPLQFSQKGIRRKNCWRWGSRPRSPRTRMSIVTNRSP
jgi:hypothetical protein